jgi:hypothetical protein
MKGRRWRLHNRKLKYLNTPTIINLCSLNGANRDIEIIPSNKPKNYIDMIIEIFNYELCMVKLINNNKILDNNKCFYIQNIYKPQSLTILFISYISERPQLYYIPIEEIKIEYRNKLDNIQILLDQPIIPDDIYVKSIEILEYAYLEMNFKWFENIQDKNKLYHKSRYGGLYRNYCIRCYEGCNINHTCDNDALRLAIILPRLFIAMDECCSNIYLLD